MEKNLSAEDKALEVFSNMMIEKLETIKSDWKKPWFTEGATAWPRNLYGREYGSANAFMLMLLCQEKGYKIPIFCTFDTVKYLNYTKTENQWKRKTDKSGNELPIVHVIKGEKSFPIFLTTYTVVNKDTQARITLDEYKLLSSDERDGYDVYPKRKVYYVFNIEQTNMSEARPEMYEQFTKEFVAEMAQKEDGYSFEPLDAMIEAQTWYCPIKLSYQNEAYYSVSKNEIVLPEKRQFESGEDFYGTAFHEMAHSTGAENLLARGLNGLKGSTLTYAREELVAEMSAALLMSQFGIEKCIKSDSLPYIKSWLEQLHEKPEFIKTVLNDVKKAVKLIHQRLYQEVLQEV